MSNFFASLNVTLSGAGDSKTASKSFLRSDLLFTISIIEFYKLASFLEI